MGAGLRGREPFLSAAQTLLDESGCTVRRWRKGNSGLAHIDDDDWAIEVPEPRGPISFGVFAHEVAHQRLHRLGRRRPRWRAELEAEDYAVLQFDRFGLPGRRRYEAHAYRHLLRAVEKAAARVADVDALEDEFLTLAPRWLFRQLLVDRADLRR